MKARVALVSASLAAVASLAGCSGSVSLGDDDEDTHEVEVRGARTGFVVEVPDEWGITDVWDADTCGSVSYLLREGSSLRLVIEAVPTSCPDAADNTQIGNGFHGVYRTLDDVPDPQDPESVDTALGAATVFTQKYFECTNSCEDWSEPVAIITLDAPADARLSDAGRARREGDGLPGRLRRDRGEPGGAVRGYRLTFSSSALPPRALRD